MTLSKIAHWVIGTLIILSGTLLPFSLIPPEEKLADAEPLPVQPPKAILCEQGLTIEQCRIRERIRSEFADIPDFERVIKCESGFRQYKQDGSVLTSETDDVGIGQINVPQWGKEAKKLGYDIFTEEGNLLMTRHVLTVQGITAWVCYNKIAGGR